MPLRRIYVAARTQRNRLRGLKLTLWILAAGGRVGPGLRVEKGALILQPPSRAWVVGRNVSIGRGVVLDVNPGAALVLGDDVKIMHYTVIGVAESLEIGSRTQIAEHCSVRDSNHDTRRGMDMLALAVVAKPTFIGRGAWVARGVAVLAGASVGDGAVIAANAVVNSTIEPNAVVGGIPARTIGKRQAP
jgi:acetyltransferase-like isoleucine patch superfamily enzyme